MRTGAKYGVLLFGSIIDFSLQLFNGEDPTDAVIKTGGHLGATATGAAIGTAIGGPIGTFIGAGIGSVGSWAFDKVYDNKEEIFEGAKNFIGDAVSGISDGLGTIFG